MSNETEIHSRPTADADALSKLCEEQRKEIERLRARCFEAEALIRDIEAESSVMSSAWYVAARMWLDATKEKWAWKSN